MNPIEYEYAIIKHEVELGCPETVIRDYLADHPDEERRLYEEGEYHSQQDRRVNIQIAPQHSELTRNIFWLSLNPAGAYKLK